MRPLLINQGERFGRLTIKEEGCRTSSGERAFLCQCDCGKTLSVRLTNLRTGNSTSCGCYRIEQSSRTNLIHGGRKNPEYNAWVNMKSRCLNSNDQSFPYYGGRGITVCDAWINSFLTFLADVGPKPSSSHSLDRIDVNGNYEPGNVRWSTCEEQARNKRNNRFLTVRGETLTIAGWADRVGMPQKSIYTRLARGWEDEKAVLTPYVLHRDRMWANKGIVMEDS